MFLPLQALRFFRPCPILVHDLQDWHILRRFFYTPPVPTRTLFRENFTVRSDLHTPLVSCSLSVVLTFGLLPFLLSMSS